MNPGNWFRWEHIDCLRILASCDCDSHVCFCSGFCFRATLHLTCTFFIVVFIDFYGLPIIILLKSGLFWSLMLNMKEPYSILWLQFILPHLSNITDSTETVTWAASHAFTSSIMSSLDSLVTLDSASWRSSRILSLLGSICLLNFHSLYSQFGVPFCSIFLAFKAVVSEASSPLTEESFSTFIIVPDLGSDREGLEALQGVETLALVRLTAADADGGRVSCLTRHLEQLDLLFLHHHPTGLPLHPGTKRKQS